MEKSVVSYRLEPLGALEASRLLVGGSGAGHKASNTTLKGHGIIMPDELLKGTNFRELNTSTKPYTILPVSTTVRRQTLQSLQPTWATPSHTGTHV